MKKTFNAFEPGSRPLGGGGFRGISTLALMLMAVSGSGLAVRAQGMPAEARQNIHTLFEGHDRVTRELRLTADGCEAVTQSKDSRIARALQAHVQQMRERLDSGLAARRWDPAFAEYRDYYDQIDFKVEKTESGVKVVAVGQTPEAIKVAQNHAKVINEFVNDGWTAHHTSHPAVLARSGNSERAQTAATTCRSGRTQGRRHCGAGCQGGIRGGPAAQAAN